MGTTQTREAMVIPRHAIGAAEALHANRAWPGLTENIKQNSSCFSPQALCTLSAVIGFVVSATLPALEADTHAYPAQCQLGWNMPLAGREMWQDVLVNARSGCRGLRRV